MDDTPVSHAQPTDDGWILVDSDGEPINDETYPSPAAAAEAAPWYGYRYEHVNYDTHED
jgi:hypothetical protein